MPELPSIGSRVHPSRMNISMAIHGELSKSRHIWHGFDATQAEQVAGTAFGEEVANGLDQGLHLAVVAAARSGALLLLDLARNSFDLQRVIWHGTHFRHLSVADATLPSA